MFGEEKWREMHGGHSCANHKVPLLPASSFQLSSFSSRCDPLTALRVSVDLAYRFLSIPQANNGHGLPTGIEHEARTTHAGEALKAIAALAMALR